MWLGELTVTVDLGRKATKTNKTNKMNAVYIEHAITFIKKEKDHTAIQYRKHGKHGHSSHAGEQLYSHAGEQLYSNSAVIAWWLQSASAQNSVHSS